MRGNAAEAIEIAQYCRSQGIRTWIGGMLDSAWGKAMNLNFNGLTEIDLKGATLFPGFTDGHAHLDGIGQRELTLNLEGSASLTEAMAKLLYSVAHKGASPQVIAQSPKQD